MRIPKKKISTTIAIIICIMVPFSLPFNIRFIGIKKNTSPNLNPSLSGLDTKPAIVLYNKKLKAGN